LVFNITEENMKNREEKTLIDAVLVLLIKDDQVLLAKKKKKIGEGKLNGYGGGMEPGETARHAAVRELSEESGGVIVEPDDLELVAIVNFLNHKKDGTSFTCRMRIYTATVWRGEPQETEEMGKPQWFDFSKVPYDQLLPADSLWLPIILSNQGWIEAWYEYTPFQGSLVDEGVVEFVSELPEE
jgi:8-oxo-dGTP diphosphatase